MEYRLLDRALLLLLSLQSYWQTAKTVEPVPYLSLIHI